MRDAASTFKLFRWLRALRLPSFVVGDRGLGRKERLIGLATRQQDLVFRIDASSFPNWDGAEQRRAVTVAGDDMTYVNAAASSGGTLELVWKRAK